MAYIIIVDDDEDFGSAVATMLRSAGYEVQSELSTKSAVVRMEQRQPDLLILDVMFPENSSAGFELARAMRHFHEELRNIPILMLTAVNTRFPLAFTANDIDDEWLPVSDFIEKPVDFDRLRNRVKALLAKAG